MKQSLNIGALYDYLRSPDELGDDLQFCVSGWLGPMKSTLTIDGVPEFTLPITTKSADLLKRKCHMAPFGKGEQTLVDQKVRDTWELNPEYVHMSKDWDETLEDIVSRVQADMKLDIPIRAELYKLLLYEEGQFFLPHRDTEKEKGMFATLVVQLPSDFKGGNIIVNHNKQQIIVENDTFPDQLQYTAFYADCEHEILPVTKGYRLALVYNVVFDGVPPSLGACLPEDLPYVENLRQWKQDPQKCVFMLDYQYTEENMSFSSLKGVDRLMLRKLLRLRTAVPLNVALAHIHLSVKGSTRDNLDDGPHTLGDIGDEVYRKFTVSNVLFAAPSDVGPHNPTRYYDNGEKEEEEERLAADEDESATPVSEISDASLQWYDSGNAPADARLAYEIEEEDLCPEEYFDGLEADEEKFKGYTGNTNATLRLAYRRSALIFWPVRGDIQMLCNSSVLKMAGMLRYDLTTSKETVIDERIRSAVQYLLLHQSEFSAAGSVEDNGPYYSFSRSCAPPSHAELTNGFTDFLQSLVFMGDKPSIKALLAGSFPPVSLELVDIVLHAAKQFDIPTDHIFPSLLASCTSNQACQLLFSIATSKVEAAAADDTQRAPFERLASQVVTHWIELNMKPVAQPSVNPNPVISYPMSLLAPLSLQDNVPPPANSIPEGFSVFIETMLPLSAQYNIPWERIQKAIAAYVVEFDDAVRVFKLLIEHVKPLPADAENRDSFLALIDLAANSLVSRLSQAGQVQKRVLQTVKLLATGESLYRALPALSKIPSHIHTYHVLEAFVWSLRSVQSVFDPAGVNAILEKAFAAVTDESTMESRIKLAMEIDSEHAFRGILSQPLSRLEFVAVVLRQPSESPVRAKLIEQAHQIMKDAEPDDFELLFSRPALWGVIVHGSWTIPGWEDVCQRLFTHFHRCASSEDGLNLMREALKHGVSGTNPNYQQFASYLTARISTEPVEPWFAPEALDLRQCGCDDCQRVLAWLADPKKSDQYQIFRNADVRKHVQRTAAGFYPRITQTSRWYQLDLTRPKGFKLGGTAEQIRAKRLAEAAALFNATRKTSVVSSSMTPSVSTTTATAVQPSPSSPGHIPFASLIAAIPPEPMDSIQSDKQGARLADAAMGTTATSKRPKPEM